MNTVARILAVLALVAFPLAIASPAGAVAAVAVPGSFASTYATPVVVTNVGGPLTFVNGDVAAHDVTALEHFLPKKTKESWCKEFPKGKCPLFWSETIDGGQTTNVQGLANLQSGQQYRFFCSVHPAMTGTLIVR